jgi:hypothetical protein
MSATRAKVPPHDPQTGEILEPGGQLARRREQTMTELLDAVRSGRMPDIQEPEQVKIRIIENILSAQTLEEAFAPGGTRALGGPNGLVGELLTISDAHLLPSEIEGALPVYMLLECVHHTAGGEKGVVVNTGSPRVMASIVWAKDHGHLPVKVRVIEVGHARPGQSAPVGLTLA